jgi:hypothetical protein
MSGSAASLPKKMKGQPKAFTNYEPDLSSEDGFQPSVSHRKEEKKKGSADIFGSSQKSSTPQGPKKKASVRITICKLDWTGQADNALRNLSVLLPDGVSVG